MLVEVSDALFLMCSMTYDGRIHKRIFWVSWDSYNYAGKGSTSNRWPVFQPSFEAIGQELGSTQARTGECSYLARMVCNMMPVLLSFCVSDETRTADQSEGGKTVGVDSTVITAR